MRIDKKGVITLGRAETRLWAAGGPEGAELSRRVRRAASELADRLGRPVEVYACRYAGGWMALRVDPSVPLQAG